MGTLPISSTTSHMEPNRQPPIMSFTTTCVSMESILYPHVGRAFIGATSLIAKSVVRATCVGSFVVLVHALHHYVGIKILGY